MVSVLRAVCSRQPASRVPCRLARRWAFHRGRACAHARGGARAGVIVSTRAWRGSRSLCGLLAVPAPLRISPTSGAAASITVRERRPHAAMDRSRRAPRSRIAGDGARSAHRVAASSMSLALAWHRAAVRSWCGFEAGMVGGLRSTARCRSMVAMHAEIILTAACGARSTVRRAETIYILPRPDGCPVALSSSRKPDPQGGPMNCSSKALLATAVTVASAGVALAQTPPAGNRPPPPPAGAARAALPAVRRRRLRPRLPRRWPSSDGACRPACARACHRPVGQRRRPRPRPPPLAVQRRRPRASRPRQPSSDGARQASLPPRPLDAQLPVGPPPRRWTPRSRGSARSSVAARRYAAAAAARRRRASPRPSPIPSRCPAATSRCRQCRRRRHRRPRRRRSRSRRARSSSPARRST